MVNSTDEAIIKVAKMIYKYSETIYDVDTIVSIMVTKDARYIVVE